MDAVLDTGGLFESLLRVAERDCQPSWFRPWLEAERNAKQLRYFNPTLVPGLLQTENYARAVLRFDDTKPEEEVERQVAARLERQEILVREHPPQVVAVIDESALRRTDAIMGEQLAHLLRMAELSHVHIHVIPTDAGLHVGLSGPLALARSADGGWVGHLENQLSGLVTDSEDEMATLLERWEGAVARDGRSPLAAARAAATALRLPTTSPTWLPSATARTRPTRCSLSPRRPGARSSSTPSSPELARHAHEAAPRASLFPAHAGVIPVGRSRLDVSGRGVQFGAP
ncbi:conserved hypothetical protein [Micromonospora sp. ATCC 39149]|nr:conserved hypothetical protein [Micromonospora sp. ATCC 39149]